ncbi:DUF2630 family protein [Kribbella pratensis]|nr:DUF2630 family protein [Kribbella pratensis]
MASVHEAIRQLVGEEHTLRRSRAGRTGDSAGRAQRLQELEVELDRCWDLLRQRRALRAAGADPGTATVRSASQVEHYLQ